MRFSLPGAQERYARLAEAMGVVPAGTPLETARAGLGIVSRLVRELHIPRLRDLLSREALDAQLDAMVREAVASGSPAGIARRDRVTVRGGFLERRFRELSSPGKGRVPSYLQNGFPGAIPPRKPFFSGKGVTTLLPQGTLRTGIQ